MANSLCFTPVCSFGTSNKPVILFQGRFKNSKGARSVQVKATGNDQSTKRNSLLCSDCEGNGNKQCAQCKGTGVNSVDHFNGRFKAGGLCWLCRGKREVLCGNCDGAGYLGGFMSS